MPDFDLGLSQVVKGRLEPIILDDEFRSTQEGHDGAFPDASIPDHDNGLLVFVINWDGFDTSVNEQFEFVEIDGVGVFVHLIFKIYELYLNFKQIISVFRLV